MKKTGWTWLRVLGLLLAQGIWAGGAAEAQEVKIHPRNQVLTTLYPRPFELRCPDVPRLMADEALSLYETDGAFFIGVGDAAPLLVGGLRLTEREAWDVNVRKLAKVVSGKAVVAY